MRTTRRQRAVSALALLLIFSVAQVYVQVGFAVSAVESKDTSAITAQSGGPVSGELITRDDQPILVNGISLKSGGTILSGATIDVPDGVGATINLGPLGQIDLAPNTQVVVEFEDGQIKVKIIRGCAIVRNKKGTSGEIYTEQGVAASNDSKKDGMADVCFPLGSPSPIVNAGAAANAGAGAGGGVGTGGGIGTGTLYTIVFTTIGGGIITALVLNGGDNPSNGNPLG
jgi:hypothetical protein